MKLPELEKFLLMPGVEGMAGVEAELRGAFAGAREEAMGAVLAGLWLRAGELEKGHKICQDIPTVLGSAWHAVMHRREGDFWNSKYWWRRAQGVAWPGWMVEEMGKILTAGGTPALQKLLRGGVYDASGFVEAVESGEAGVEVLQEVQELEWRGLFEVSMAGLG